MPETQLASFGLFIDGESVGSESGREFESEDPYAGHPWARVADGTPADVDAAVAAARRAFEGEWGAATGFERAAVMRACAEAISAHADELAVLEVRDSGKLLREMRGQMGFLASWFLYFAGLADKLEGRTVPAANPNFFCYTRREPVGVVGCITPWNSPLLLLTWKLAPLLAAGNTCVAKPSEHAPASTVKYAEILHEAGLPAGVLNVVTAWDRGAGEALAAHPGIDKVAFTGSTATGVKVAQAAVKNVNRVTLELGGKSPHVVFPDADLEAAANGVIAGVFAATGQTCMAGSRLIVHEEVHDELVAKVVARADAIVLGDPTAPETEMGPVANRPQYEKVLGYLEGAVAEGATFACGGAPDSDRGGLFVRPTVVTGRGARQHGRPRGGVRARGRRLHVPRGSRGARPRQRHGLRPGRRGLDQGHPSSAPAGRRDPRRDGVGQRLPRRRAEHAVRRLRPEWPGPGERHAGDRRVPRDQVRVRGAHGRDAGSVPARVNAYEVPRALSSSAIGRFRWLVLTVTETTWPLKLERSTVTPRYGFCLPPWRPIGSPTAKPSPVRG